MKGLEPSTFCISSERSVRARALKVPISRSSSDAIEPERTRTNDERDHCDHAAPAPNASIEPEAELRPPRAGEAGKRGGDPRIGETGQRPRFGQSQTEASATSDLRSISGRRSQNRSNGLSCCECAGLESRYPSLTERGSNPSPSLTRAAEKARHEEGKDHPAIRFSRHADVADEDEILDCIWFDVVPRYPVSLSRFVRPC
jgi:hypothetical protein